jgi:hypothetical protein
LEWEQEELRRSNTNAMTTPLLLLLLLLLLQGTNERERQHLPKRRVGYLLGNREPFTEECNASVMR